MDLQGIKLNEISQTKTILYHLTYTGNLKKPNLQKQRIEWWLPGTREWGRWGDIV